MGNMIEHLSSLVGIDHRMSANVRSISMQGIHLTKPYDTAFRSVLIQKWGLINAFQ